MKSVKRILVVAVWLLVAGRVFAQGVEGIWEGALAAGGMKLRLVLKISKGAGGALTGTMDSLDQGAANLPVSAIHVEGSAVRLELKSVGGVFEGTLAGGELSGQWKQGGASLPLTFRRVEKAPTLSRPQEPKKPYPYDEQDVTFENKAAGVKLAGTLTLPRSAGPHPAVLLISGSGPQDRDETVFGHRPFLVLADALTRRGIAVLRVDDRGVGGSTGKLSEATSEDLAGDALAGVAFLKSVKQVDGRRIGLIGHSEGAIIAPMVAVRPADVAFIVLLAAPGVAGEQILYAQGEAIGQASGTPEAVVAKNRQLQERLFAVLKQEKDPAAAEKKLREAWKEMGAPEAAGEAQVKGVLTPWFRFFLTYDPAPVLRQLKCPTLVLSGERDVQVPPKQNLPALAAAFEAGGLPVYEIVKLRGLNHLFQTSKTGSPREYAAIEETMAPVVLELIGDWILKRALLGAR